MKQITLNIPDNKYDFFLELVENLGLDKDLSSGEIVIPEEHKRIVLERIRKSEKDPSRLLKWEDVKDDFTFQ